MNENIQAFNRVQKELNTGKEYVTGKGVVPVTKTVDVAKDVNKVPKRTPSLLDTYKQEASNLSDIQRTSQQEADAYAAQIRQARIDAINKAFAPRIEREQQAGQDRLSRVAAINFKSGTLGSGVDTTRTGEQKNLNEKALQAIEQEKAIAINEAFGYADQLGKERAALLTKQRQEGAEAKVKYAQDKVDLAMRALDTFGETGTSLDAIKQADPQTYETLRDVSGLSDLQLSTYIKSKTPQAKVLKTEVVGNKVLTVTQNPDGSVSTETFNTNITPEEEFKAVDGVAYGVTRGADGKLIFRKLDSVDNGAGGDFSSPEVEQDFREDSVSLLDSIDAGNLTTEQAYKRLRKLYSPTEVSDRAIRSQLDMVEPVAETKSGFLTGESLSAPKGNTRPATDFEKSSGLIDYLQNYLFSTK